MKYFLIPGVLILGIFCASFPVTAAFAQVLRKTDISEEERAVFAYFTFNKSVPSYTKWIQTSKIYKNAPDAETATQIFKTESRRLKWGFKNYDIKKDFLKIKTDVLLQLTEKDPNGTATLVFNFPHEDSDYIPYFPYHYGDEWISLLVENLPQFSRLPLTETQYLHIKNFLPEAGEIYEGKLMIEVRPIAADNDKPFELDGVYQWLMMGDVASIECSALDPATGEERALWEYSAPWYLTESEDLLQELFRE